MNLDEIRTFLGEDWINTLKLIHSTLESDIDLLNKTNSAILSHGGKQLRPLMSLLVARACSGGLTTADSLRFAAASELLHNATLLHDDVVDGSSERRGVPTVMRILDDRVVTPLGRVTGVGTVSVAGAPAREIHVYCDPAKLQAYGLSVAGISQIIATENRNVPSGSIDIGTESFSLRVEKEFKDPSELLDVVVGYRFGQVVYLRDVARVDDGLEEKSQESYTNGREGKTLPGIAAIQE